MKRFIAAAVVCIVATQLNAELGLKGLPSELAQYLQDMPKSVVITGEAEYKIPADRAIVSLKVITENKSLQESLHSNQEIRAKINALLNERGIPADRVSASKFSSTAKFGLFGDKPKSYTVENVVKITVRDEKEFQLVTGLVDSWAEVRYFGIEFEHSDKNALKSKVLAQAIDKADEQKRLYEDKLGVKLTPMSFKQGVISVGAPSLGGEEMEKYYALRATPISVPASSSLGYPTVGGQRNESEMPNEFGEMIYKTQVTIEYSVKPK